MPAGAPYTAMQAGNSSTLYRLVINSDGLIAKYHSSDGGVNWNSTPLALYTDLPICKVVTLPISNAKHFTLTFEKDVELYSIQNAGVGYIGEISVVGWTKTNARNYEIYLSASFNGNGSFAIIYI